MKRLLLYIFLFLGMGLLFQSKTFPAIFDNVGKDIDISIFTKKDFSKKKSEFYKYIFAPSVFSHDGKEIIGYYVGYSKLNKQFRSSSSKGKIFFFSNDPKKGNKGDKPIYNCNFKTTKHDGVNYHMFETGDVEVKCKNAQYKGEYEKNTSKNGLAPVSLIKTKSGFENSFIKNLEFMFFPEINQMNEQKDTFLLSKLSNDSKKDNKQTVKKKLKWDEGQKYRDEEEAANLKNKELVQLAQKKVEDKILLAPGMRVYFYFVGEQNREKKRLISIRYKKLKGKENFENWKLSDNPDLIRVPKILYYKLKSAVDFDIDTPSDRKKAHEKRKRLLYSFNAEEIDMSKYDGVYLLKNNTCEKSKPKAYKYFDFVEKDHMNDFYLTIRDSKMIKSKWSKKNKWNYKINVQPEKNETKLNINIRSKKGLWDGEIVEDKIFLKFKGKNDKEQKKYGDCELLFTNQFWSANNIETAKVDKKDKIFEKIVSEYAKHTKQENKIDTLIADLSKTQKEVEEEKKKKELLLAQKEAEEEKKKEELLLAKKKAEEEERKIKKAEEEKKKKELLLAQKKAEEERKKQEKILAQQKKEEEKRKKELLLAQKAEDEKKKQELLLAQKKAEEERKKQELLLAQKKAEEEKKKEELLLAQKKADEERKKKEEFKPEEEGLDNEAPVIEIAETITVNDNSYEIEGKVTDKSDKIFIKIAGKIVKVENGKFNIKRFSPVDEAIKIVAIDQWGNESKPKTINIIVDVEDSEIAEILEPLDPSKIESKESNTKVALIIGIEKYDQSPKASFANLDAQYFFDYARRGFGIKKQNIKILVDEDASLSKTYTAIFKWLPGKIKSNETDLIIFFSGHGLASSDGKSKYILPSDADPDLLSKTALSRSELFDQIINLNPKSVTMFFDTCYSGVSRDEETLLASAKPLRIVADESNAIPDNFTIFTASKAEQISSGLEEAKHGIFSYYLMKGLEGEADTNEDKKITNGEMLAYMDENVSERALDLGRQQNPALSGDPDKILMSYR